MEEKVPENRAVSRFIRILREHFPSIAERYKVKSLTVFGSYLRGEQERGSDLDLLVEFYETPSLFQYIRLERHLSELLGVKVDLVMKGALKPAIGKRILGAVVRV